jgi:membrane protein
VGSVLRWLDRQQKKRSWIALPFAVVKKFSEDSAGNLAALIAYYMFFSLFPLLLVAFTVLGFVAAGDPSLQARIHDSLISQFPVFGKQLPAGSLHGNAFALVVGSLLALWSGLGVGKTAQNAFDAVYGVPKDERIGFPMSLLRALRLIVVGGVGFIATTMLGGLVTDASRYGVNLGIGLEIVGALVVLVANIGLFALIFRWAPSRDMTWREVLPGATLAAAAWSILEHVGAALLNHKVAGAQSTYGTFATVIGILSWFYLQAQITLMCAEVNVVLAFRLWPRSLKDPPTTEADLRAEMRQVATVQ